MGSTRQSASRIARLNVVKSDPPESREVLASAIVSIGKAADKLYESGLNRDAVVVLLQHKTKLPARSIRSVLDGLRRLESWYCK